MTDPAGALSRLQEALGNLVFSRALVATLLANLLTLVTMNTLALRPVHLLVVFPLALIGGALAMGRARVRRLATPVPPALAAFAIGFAIFLSLLRLPYLLEWLPGNVVLVTGDDWGRLAELISMTLSERFPLRHFANQDYLLSHYYSPFFPMALVKLAIPWLTLKDAIAVASAAYYALIALSLVETAGRLCREPSSRVALVALTTVFAGLDWVFGARLPEHWMDERFGAVREVSSFFTVQFYAVHHFLGFHAIILAWVLARSVRFRARGTKPALLGLLLVGAFNSSVFAVLPLVLVALPELVLWLRKAWRTRALLPVAAAFLLPLFLYTNRPVQQPFEIAPALLLGPGHTVPSLVCYLLLVAVVDLGGIPLLLVLFIRRMTGFERRCLLASWLFLVTTFFIASAGHNNHSMRGMLLPSYVFFLLFARHVAPSLAALARRGRAIRLASLALVGLLVNGSAQHWGLLLRSPLRASYWTWEVRGISPPMNVRAHLRRHYHDLPRDRSSSHWNPPPRDRRSFHKYQAEKLIDNIPLEEMLTPEREQARRPRKSFFW